MDLVYARNVLSAREVEAGMEDAPSYSTVRTLLGVLVEKGHLRTEKEGRALMYRPERKREAVAKSAMQRVVDTFFGGSVEKAMVGLIDSSEKKLSADEVARLESAIRQHEKKGN